MNLPPTQSKNVLTIIVAAALISAPYPGTANTKDVASATVSAVTGTLSFGLFLIPAAWIELDNAAWRGAAGGGDPADTNNYAIRANPTLVVPPVPDLSNATPEFKLIATNLLLACSEHIQSIRGLLQSRDRLAGAQLVGTPQDVANQQFWLAKYEIDAAQRRRAIAPIWAQYAVQLSAESPEAYGYSVSCTNITTVRDQEATGIFPQAEQYVADGWHLSPFELSLIETYFAGIPDAIIAQNCPMIISNALAFIQEDLAETPIPVTLEVQRLPSFQASVAWPTNANGFALQTASNLSAPNWTSVTNSIQVLGERFVVTLASTQPTAFFRLSHP